MRAEALTISEDCKAELEAFKIDRASNINKHVALAYACRRDVQKHCKPTKKDQDPDEILDCLRDKRKKVRGPPVEQQTVHAELA